uniref:Uncharacterized protein n=1 Tax=Tanacetum cinerariifolium TaxID=118510 RepID=A0A699GLT7_TANCI|nr:hypothetical protein [Tanacetum cinerariifolium]
MDLSYTDADRAFRDKRGAKSPLPAAHPELRRLVVPGIFGTGRRLRPGVADHPRRARGRGVHRQRPENLDHAGPARRHDVLPGAHRRHRAQAGGHFVPVDRHDVARRHRAAHRHARRGTRGQRVFTGARAHRDCRRGPRQARAGVPEKPGGRPHPARQAAAAGSRVRGQGGRRGNRADGAGNHGAARDHARCPRTGTGSVAAQDTRHGNPAAAGRADGRSAGAGRAAVRPRLPRRRRRARRHRRRRRRAAGRQLPESAQDHHLRRQQRDPEKHHCPHDPGLVRRRHGFRFQPRTAAIRRRAAALDRPRLYVCNAPAHHCLGRRRVGCGVGRAGGAGHDRVAGAGRPGRFRRQRGRPAGGDAGTGARPGGGAVFRHRVGRVFPATGRQPVPPAAGRGRRARQAGVRARRKTFALRPGRHQNPGRRQWRRLPSARHQDGGAARRPGRRPDRVGPQRRRPARRQRRQPVRGACRHAGHRHPRLPHARRPARGHGAVQPRGGAGVVPAGPLGGRLRAARRGGRLRRHLAVRGSAGGAGRAVFRHARLRQDAAPVRRGSRQLPGRAAPHGGHVHPPGTGALDGDAGGSAHGRQRRRRTAPRGVGRQGAGGTRGPVHRPAGGAVTRGHGNDRRTAGQSA